MLSGDKVCASAIRERIGLDRMPDRPPHLDDGETALEQIVRLVGQHVAHPLRRGPFGIVVVHATHDLADFLGLAQFVVGGAQRMVEHDDALGAALGFDQCFHLRVVDAADFVVVEEIADRGVMPHETEAVALQREIFDVRTAVMDFDAPRIGRAAGAASWPPGPAVMVKILLPSSTM